MIEIVTSPYRAGARGSSLVGRLEQQSVTPSVTPKNIENNQIAPFDPKTSMIYVFTSRAGAGEDLPESKASGY